MPMENNAKTTDPNAPNPKEPRPKVIKPSVGQLCRSPSMLLAFGFGSGLSPWAPGTLGTVMAIPFYLGLRELDNLTYSIFLLVSFFAGVFFCNVASHKLKVHDHGGIVWDEMVGYWLTMLFAPRDWWWIVLGFVLFRVFDIVKPWPISIADKKIHGGFGIMFDDVLAAVYAFVCLQFLVWLFAYYGFL